MSLTCISLYSTQHGRDGAPGSISEDEDVQGTNKLGSGVARLPFMGYNTWNAYYCDIDEDIVLTNAKRMVELGFVDLGYNYMNVDDCWAEKNRSADGFQLANKKTFPSGMKSLTDKIHEMGMKAGIYSDSGWFTCQLYPGSFQHEEQDAETFMEWGFDLLKFDNCAIPFDTIVKEGVVGKFHRMAEAINKVSTKLQRTPLVYSLCQWGWGQPWLWAREISQSWRTTGDIEANWKSVTSILNANSFIAWANNFYGHNDMDIVLTMRGRPHSGNGDLSYEEAKSHFTAWALMKSPLLISCDLTTISDESFAILSNKEIIAINQDPVEGKSIVPFRWGVNPDWTSNVTHPAQYWSGKTQNGTVIMLLNTLDEPADMFFNLTESPWIRAGRQYHVRDLWTHTLNGTALRNFTAQGVPSHGVVALLLQDAGDEPDGIWPPCVRREWCMASNGTAYWGDNNGGWAQNSTGSTADDNE
ncbi:glycoside hydrolase family 27 protein [Stereum hirsutum FP-91666 SS1]|uniref:glycoside hydrolase family 27 protein n=1 Tax=Stereum hirsutum (strain FP-91666) TaxID=721885 RepID=UPI000440EFA9|nr:glycoside hydrolase family 27 protein [Stereum hirsutum FP-91666 SS1]EIM88748.1 glycoside hydrolase family 27 protein [Stereum hirsutum FP-91666 SS1]